MSEQKTVTASEPVKAVSNEQVTTGLEATPDPIVAKEKNVDEFKLPTTKEEFEKAMKAAVNREKTNFLKELGVKSVKEYREQNTKAQEALTQFEELTKQKQALTQEKEAVSQQYESLKQTHTLDMLGVKPEYREDMVKLAQDKVTAENSFETVLKQLIETKYQYTVQGKGNVKFGTEKTTEKTKDSTMSTELQKKYSWLK